MLFYVYIYYIKTTLITTIINKYTERIWVFTYYTKHGTLCFAIAKSSIIWGKKEYKIKGSIKNGAKMVLFNNLMDSNIFNFWF